MSAGRSIDVAVKLKDYLERAKVWHRFFELPEHTMTVDAASRQLGVPPDKIIKTLLLLSEAGEPVIAIVCGDRKVDLSKVAVMCGSRVRMAKAREVERFTGYPVGAVPPVGHGLRTFVDKCVASHERVIGGGGTTHTLIEMRVEDVVKLTNAVLCDISE
ncbi:MAG: aminoacyl-tRNA deacylase [Zestosphaera sp.]